MKIVIFAPHQDDELNIFGTLFVQYKKAGFDIDVVFITNGDAYGIEKVRYIEAQKVKKILNISNLLFFGFSDSGTEDSFYPTIYNNGNKVYVSPAHHDKTYKPYDDDLDNYFPKKLGIDSFSFTRDSLLKCIISYLRLAKPEIIITTSWDNHPDHITASALVSEAILDICKKEKNYRPLYLETFSYLGNWLGKDDYFLPVPVETLKGKNVNASFPYKWDQRIKVFVDKKELSLRFWRSQSFKAYHAYTSVKGTSYFFRCANTDKCFWEKSIHNIALFSSIECSSGNPKPLNDYKLLDSKNIRNHTFSIDNKDLIHWTPSNQDLNPTISIKFGELRNIQRIIIHQGYGHECFECSIKISGQLFNYIVDDLCFAIVFQKPLNASSLEIRIRRLNNSAIAIREIEIFDNQTNTYLKDFLNASDVDIYKKRYLLPILFVKVIRRLFVYVENRKYLLIHRK